MGAAKPGVFDKGTNLNQKKNHNNKRVLFKGVFPKKNKGDISEM